MSVLVFTPVSQHERPTLSTKAPASTYLTHALSVDGHMRMSKLGVVLKNDTLDPSVRHEWFRTAAVLGNLVKIARSS